MEKKMLQGKLFLVIFLLIISIGVLIPVLMNLKLGLDLQGGFELLYNVTPIEEDTKVDEDLLRSTRQTLLRRIDVLGVTEPSISIEGDRIRVQLAGVTNEDEARSVLSQTASLTFRDTSDNLLMTSSVLKSGGARVSMDQSGRPAVALSIKDNDAFYKATKKVSEMSDNRIVIWLDYEEGRDSFEREEEMCGSDGSACLSAATVSQAFSGDVIIQGNFTEESANDLVDLINSGSMPAKLTEVSSNSVGASFGTNALVKTVTAGIIGIGIIIALLIVLYRFSGLIASVGIIIYTSLTFFIFWLLGGTMTLSGIAAMIIGIGMAVDSNVINFSRIKDELYEGSSLKDAYEKGNKASFGTIMDANITTLIAALVLFVLGQSSVKGFATVLIISIISTLLIMVFLVRWLLRKFVQTGYFDDKVRMFIGVKKEDIPNLSNGEKRTKYFWKKIDFVKSRKIFIICAFVIIILGCVFIFNKGLSLGVDFRGGTAITVDTKEKLTEKKISSDMDSLGYDMYSFEKQSDGSYSIKISETVDTDKTNEVKDYLNDKYDAKTDIEVISDMVRNDLIKNAVLSLIISMVAIIIYISLRFKFDYGISSIIALVFNVLITIAFFGIFRFEVSNIFIAAILSIIGYSVNDVIITFDRIRENYNKKKAYSEKGLINIVNESLRGILNRSIVTTLTAVIPLGCLIIFGSHEILSFYVAMLVGMVTGVLTSLFIASQLWLEIEKRNLKKPKKPKKEEKEEVSEIEIKGINA